MFIFKSVVHSLFVVALVGGSVRSSDENVVVENRDIETNTVPDVENDLIEVRSWRCSATGGENGSAFNETVNCGTGSGQGASRDGDSGLYGGELIDIGARVNSNITALDGPSADLKNTTTDVGVRLILTGMVEAGNISEARRLSQVSGGPFPAHITSYSGFLTVDHRFNSNLFFWFFPCEVDYENAPVLLWLQGGPGCSSLIGLFFEIGPFLIGADGASLVENPYSWHKNYSLVYIDSPVGAGFSYTEHGDGYATNQTQIGDSLYSALIQFFKLFPELKKNEFFIAGESYAGKYIPILARTIHANNPEAALKINLKGLSVGNGFTDPVNMVQASEFVYQLGLADSNVRDKMQAIEERIVRLIQTGEMEKATREMFSSPLRELTRFSDVKNIYNILKSSKYTHEDQLVSFVNKPDARTRLHVGDTNFTGSHARVQRKLLSEIMVSVKPALEELLEHYRVLYYSGQLDLAVTYPMSVNMYKSLNWTAADEYKQAERVPWYVNGELAGYMKSAGKFTEVLVRNAGHAVPIDQPVWARDLITRFTSDNLPRPRRDGLSL